MKTNKHGNNIPLTLRELARRALVVLLTLSMVSMNTPFAYAAETGELQESIAAQSDAQSNTQENATSASDEQKSEEPAEDLPSVEGQEEQAAQSVDQGEEGDSVVDQPDERTTGTLQTVDVVEEDSSDAEAEETVIALALDNAYIHCSNQIIAPPTDTLAVPTGKEIVFAASPNQGYELHEVKALYQGDEVVLEQDDQGLYTVPAYMVQAGMKLVVTAIGIATEDAGEAIPIDEERNTQSTFEYEDAEVKVTATIDDPSVLPANVQFKVTRILPNSADYNYDAYMEALNNKAKDEAAQGEKPFVYDDQNTMLYDTAFMDGDVELKLDDTQVRFTFEFKKNQLADKFDAERGDQIDLLHLPLVDSVRDSVDSTADATDITADDVKVEGVIAPRVDAEGDTTSFALDSLSTHAVVLEQGDRQVAQPKPVSATVRLYDTDGTTSYPLHNHEYTYYIRVKAKDDEGNEYYALKEIDLRDRSEASVTIDYIAKSDEELVFGETPDSVALTTDYTIDQVRLVNNSLGEITSYEDALAANDKVQGFEFKSMSSNDDKTQNTITLNRLAHQRAYGIRLHFDTNNISVAENDGYAILATVTHQSTEKTYYFQKLSLTGDQLTRLSDGTYAYNIPVDKFKNQNGEDRDGFTGNEIGIEARIVQLFDGAGRHEAIQGQKSLKLNQGANFKNYVINGFERIVESNDNGSKDTTYDTINMSEIQATNDYNYQSILGAAINYGITADHVTQANDLQTNFATNLFSNTGHSITPNLAGHAGTFVFADAEWKENRWVIDFASPGNNQGKINLIWGEDKKPSGANENTPLKDNGDWGYTTLIGMQSKDITDTIVDPMISYCQTKSEELANHASTIATPSVSNRKSVLDVSGFADDATIYVDADNYISEINEGELLIVKARNQTIVFNFDETENLQINRIRIKYKGEGNEHSSAGDSNPGGQNGTLDGDAKHLIWNCASVKQLNIKEGVGIFLVPKTDSTTTVLATSSGWIVSGGHFTNPNGEWHGIYGELPDNDTATLRAFKTVDGSAAQGNQKFVFTFEKYDGNGQYGSAKTANSDGSAVSANINTFSKGWNVYKITETGKAETTQGEYEFDTTAYYAAIKYEQRTLGGNNGSVFIASQPRYFRTFHEDRFSANASDATAFMEDPVSGIPTFANTSKTSSLTIKKTVTNQPANMKDDVFEFDVFLRENGNKVNGPFDAKVYVDQDSASEERTVTFANGKATVSLKGDQRMVISGLRIGMQYEVKENKPANATWTNTSATNAKGSLTAKSSAPVAEFENEYDTVIELETTAHVTANKQMRNNYWGNAKSFTFTLTAVEDDAPMPQGAQTVEGKQVVTITANKGESGAPVAIDFGEIDYKALGTYHYEIREKNDGISYVDYDDSVYTATVSVEQVGNELVATTTYAKNNNPVQDNKATFTNEYKVDEGIDVQFEAKKSLEGKELEEGAYTFVLLSTGGTPAVSQTKTNAARSQGGDTATVVFDTIHYELDDLSRTDRNTGLKYDVFTYTIYEQQGSDSDVLFDSSSYTASVAVYDNGDGTLRKSDPVYKLNGQVKDEALFVNRTFEDSVTFGGNKTVTGRSFHGARGEQAADSFTFTAQAVEVGANGAKTPISADSYLVPDDVTITPTSGVTAPFAFEPVTYSYKDVGHTYEYTIKEVAPNNAGAKDHLAYSDASYTVTVRVAMGKDDAGNDKLQITTTGNPTNLSFTNAYSGSASVALQAQKTLNGTDPGNATYTFELWEAERVVNGGEVTFSKVGDEPIATTTNQGQSVTFEGIPELSYTQETLHTSAGFFSDNGYSQSRQLYYIVAETPGSNTDYVTYDASEKHYTVVVSSALEADGNLRAYVLDEGEQYTSQDKTFANTQVEGASVQLKAHKTMKNANLSDFDPFTIDLYEVKDGEDVELQSQTTNRDGYVSFDAITYKKGDIGTHVYKIREQEDAARADFITFDTHTETVRVKVSEDATSHKLIAQIVGEDGKPLVDDEGNAIVSPYMAEFENAYKASIDISLDATKNFAYLAEDGAKKEFADGDFSFVLTGYGINADGEIQGTKDGVAKFGKRTITMEDMLDATGHTYQSEKTFTYTVTEKVPDDAVNADGRKYGELEGDARYSTFVTDGITYTGMPKTISVKVTDDHMGHLTASYNGGEYQSPSFTNTYDATGEYAFEATKMLDETPYADQQGSSKFSFSLYRGTDAEGEPIQTVTTVGQNGKISFDPVEFSLAELRNADGDIAPKTFDFTIKENNTGSAHYNYDTAEKHVKLTVSDGGGGKLDFELADDSDEATFANTTRDVADGEVQFVANKMLNGNPSGKAFTFYLEQKQADNTYVKIQDKASQTEGEQKGIATFDKITYGLDQVGDYEYRIHEYIPEDAERVGETDKYLFEGMTYDGKNVDITVHVRDNKDTNELDVTYQVNGAAETAQLPTITFDNTYSATNDFTINATKTLVGRAFHGADEQKGLVADRIEFVVTGAELDQDGNVVSSAVVPMPTEATKVIAPTSGTTANVGFGAIHYTQDNAGKVYRYTVTETVCSGDSVSTRTTTDENGVVRQLRHYVDVQVTDDEKGGLTVTPTYFNEGDEENTSALAFYNDYDASGELELEGKKTIEGRPMKDADVYTFQIEEKDEMGNSTGRSWTAKNADESGKATESIAFEYITYGLEDRDKTYSYTVTEVAQTNNGMSLKTPADGYAFSVTITDNGDGTLGVTQPETAKKLDFVNEYTVAGVDYQFHGQKELTGRALKDDDVFGFNVTQYNATVQDDGSVVYDTEAAYSWDVTNKDPQTDKATSTINFPTLSFAKNDERDDTGIKKYVISEASLDETSPITAKTETYTVELKVYDDGTGKLKVEELSNDLPDSFDFVNEYKASKEVTFGGTKAIEGRQFKLGDKFDFEVLSADGVTADGEKVSNVAVPDAVTIRPESGTEAQVQFQTTYGLEDVGNTYTYTFHEKGYGLEDESYTPGVTYDTTVYEAVFTVVKDNGDGTLEVTGPVYKNAAGTDEIPSDEVKFTNSYQAQKTSYVLEGKKTLSVATNLAAGQGAPTLTRGAFTFELRDATGATLQEVQNGYRINEDGSQTEVDPGTFAFKPIEASVASNATGIAYSIVEVINDQAVNDDGVTYADAKAAAAASNQEVTGTFTLDGLTYDSTVHYARVVITDDYAGTLTPSVVYDNRQNDAPDGENVIPTFNNSIFKAQARVEFDKYYIGNGNQNEQFSFSMIPASVDETGTYVEKSGVPGITLTQGQFDENHLARVVSDTITYTQPGDYYYVVREQGIDASRKVSADNSKILVHVEVAQDENNKQKVTTNVDYAMSFDNQVVPVNESESPILYNNGRVSLTYRSAALRMMAASEHVASFEPAVHKVLKSGVLKGGEFEFSIYAGTEVSGNALETVTNDANGTVKFNAMQFGTSDIGTHEYTIVERAGTDEAILYDKDPIKLTVTVSKSESGDGELLVNGVYEDKNEEGQYVQTDNPTFVNSYDSIVIHTVKRSREEPYDPLPGAHYGLWMVNPNGEDIYMGLGRNQQQVEGSELVSSDNGDLYYDIPMLEGVAYYFLEEWPPPAGHLVDPYPTDLFTLVHDKDGSFRLVYELDDEFATYCPGVTYDMADGGKA